MQGGITPIRCAICDDDYAFLKVFLARVEAAFAARGMPCACQVFLNPSELLMASFDSFDIVFLNVDTGYWDGINIARDIRRTGAGTLIIFVSAHVQFAPHGYGVGAFRYLMKDELDATLAPAVEDALERLGHPEHTLAVRSHKEEYRLPLACLVYAESDKRVITYHMRGFAPATLRAYGKLSLLEASLSDRGFLRVHKSYLVNLRFVESIKNYEVHLQGGPTLQTSRQHYRDMVGALTVWQEKHK